MTGVRDILALSSVLVGAVALAVSVLAYRKAQAARRLAGQDRDRALDRALELLRRL